MTRLLKKSTIIVAGALLFAALYSGSAYALSIGPVCDTCQGGIYSLTYEGVALPDADPLHETFRITYEINTATYNGGGSYLDQIALKVSSSVYDVSIFDDNAPGGAAAWTPLGKNSGINGSGCSGSGNGFTCADSTIVLNGGLGLAVPGGTYTWIFDVTVNNGMLFAGLEGSTVKARYVDANGYKVGNLVSEKLTTVPEPSTLLLLGSGLLAFGFVARRSRRSNT